MEHVTTDYELRERCRRGTGRRPALPAGPRRRRQPRRRDAGEDRARRADGACGGCPMASITLKLGIERVLAEEVPELAGVEAVNVETWTGPEFE